MSKIVLHISSDLLALTPQVMSPSRYAIQWKSLEPEFTNYLIVPRRRRSYGRTEITTLGRESHVSVFGSNSVLFWGVNRLNWGEISGQAAGRLKPSLIHSHKLSYEAYIGDALARSLTAHYPDRGSRYHWRNPPTLIRQRFTWECYLR